MKRVLQPEPADGLDGPGVGSDDTLVLAGVGGRGVEHVQGDVPELAGSVDART